MKLTTEQKVLLLDFGYPEEDFEQIEQSLKFMEYELTKDGKDSKITAQEVKELLTVQDFTSGIARVAFHWTAYRGNDKEGIHFDCSKMFNE